ncbi:MAG TPA: nucleotidyl transferase AbiEii/AbiGii toxin family protein [archaeon]|nr:nucleotidyl transferase AbiEii/AbiGii toxin family protein [archaeon]
MGVLISRKQLEEIARERNLSLAIIQKDWALGWILYGISSRVPELVFTGGTALSKVYFPKMWRLSEDLDFALPTDISNEELISELGDALVLVENDSQIKAHMEKPHSNPGYIQVKVKFEGPLYADTAKIDIKREPVLDEVRVKDILKNYPDYKGFTVRVKSLEEILARKIVTLMSRDRIRDYYDVWLMMTETEVNVKRAGEIMKEYVSQNKVGFNPENIFTEDIERVLQPYWDREILRLANPKITLKAMLAQLKKQLQTAGIIQGSEP